MKQPKANRASEQSEALCLTGGSRSCIIIPMSKLHTYDVRLQLSARGRRTVRVRATDAKGARAAAEQFEFLSIVNVKRSTYAR